MLSGSAGVKLSFKSSIEECEGLFNDVAWFVVFWSSISFRTVVIVDDILFARKMYLTVCGTKVF